LYATNKALDDIEDRLPISDWSRIKHIFEFAEGSKSLFRNLLNKILYKKDLVITDLQHCYDILVNYIVCHEIVLASMKKNQDRDLMKKIEKEVQP